MTIMLVFAILGAWGTDLASGSWVSLGGDYQGPAQAVVLQSDDDHAVFRLDLSGYAVKNEMGYTRFDLPGTGWNADTPIGHPELPLVPVVVGLPAGMNPEATLLEAEWVQAGTGRAYPVQPPLFDCDYTYPPFAELSDNLTGVYPRSVLGLHEQGSWAGANTVVLQFNPFRWNSETGEFQVASSLTARVDFTGNRDFQHSVRPEIASMHSSRIINYDDLGIPVDGSPVSSEDVVYICVVPPENLEAVTPLLAMVNALGHRVHVIELEIGTNSYTMKNAISGVYQPGVTRFALIAATHQQLESKAYGSFVGDYYYECMDADNLPDIAVGRYAATAAQIPNQVDKTMSYVSYTGEPGEPSVPASVLLAAHEENYPGKYTANSNEVKNWDYQLADPVFETCYPPEGGTAEQVTEAINGSVGIVNYRGHGSNTVWQWSPGWNAGTIYALENTHFPPVFNVCCSNGNHSQSYACLSQSWNNGPGVGASGNIGASAPSLTTVNNRMQRVLFWEIFDEGNTCAGEVFSASQTDIIQTQGGGGLNNARMYHWFGDPSMDIPNSDLPGTPLPLSVDAPEALNPGENTLHLTVTSGGTPVEGAVVTVTDGIGNHPSQTETFYAQEITNATGEVWLDFTADESDLYYGVRLHNYGSLFGMIEITTQGIEGGGPLAATLSRVTPAPAAGTASVSFTAPEGTSVGLRVLDIAGRTVAVLHDHPVPGGEATLSIDTSAMSPGVYFVVMQTPETTITRKMAVVR